MPTTLTFDFTAEMPPAPRGRGAGRPSVEWERLLDPARKNPGKAGKIFEFTDRVREDDSVVTAQAQAQSRALIISNRLHAAVPLEEWKFNIRKLPDGKVGLWTTYVREMTVEQFAEYEKLRKERGEKIKAGREAKAAAKTVVSGNSDNSHESAAEKVKAAREAKGVQSVPA